MRAPTDHLSDISARIKELYIELNDYAYFHGPSDIGREDRRFSGRREVLSRLKSLLSDHECPSGAYLVTGFRGAGKSSVVAKALAWVMPPQIANIGIRRVLRIVAPVAASALFPLPTWTLYPLLPAALFFLVLLICTDARRPDRLAARHVRSTTLRRLGSWPLSLGRALVLEAEEPPCTRERAFLQDALAICAFIAGFTHFSPVQNPPDMPQFWLRLTAGLLYCLAFPAMAPVARSFPWRRGSAAYKKWFGHAWLKLQNLRVFKRKIVVKVNLSQDNLRELDVLRLIAGGLETQYRFFSRPTASRTFFRLLLLLPFLLLSYLLYTRTLVGWMHDLKVDIHVPCYLPSQGSFLLDCSGLPKVSGAQDIDDLGTQTERAGATCYRELVARHLGGGAHKTLKSRLGAEAFREELERAVLTRWRRAAAREIPPRHYFLHKPDTSTVFGKIEALGQTLGLYADAAVEGLVDRVAHYLPKWVKSSWYFSTGTAWPRTIDYFAGLFLLLGWWLPPIVLRHVFGRMNHRDVLAQLVELNAMIDAEVTHERGAIPVQANTWLSVGFGRRRSQTFKVLSERDIEKRLLEILDLTQRISPLEVRPEFIVVFDELDKIQHEPAGAEPPTGNSPSRKDRVEPVARGGGHEHGFASVEAERARQHLVLGLVSNLKHFLSTAPAKFIFIAGREMFDAALADVSDRQFFMGSVFNEVIHVPSFHTDASDDRLPDITSLPEQYVCRFLLPRHWLQERPSLRSYRKYLDTVLLPPDDGPNMLRLLRRDKILYELHNFITYLTYRSNGAPKKVTALFERFVGPLSDTARSGEAACLVLGRSSSSLYLRFNYYDQYAFGLVTFLASPLLFSVNRAIKDYGDKILVSSSFVLDHIFKFHGQGFSWRNLELLPEVVDASRAPQLRELLGHVMRFLARGQINEIISGLYDFKFTRRISEEIAILSKISEHESAAFNFTLDESLALKRHFYAQLHRVQDRYVREGSHSEGTAPFINSLSFLHMIIGDLHFYDGEYDSAIIEYMEAVQPLRERDPKLLSSDTLLLMVRNFLKLGLAFERKKSFDSALMSYSRVSELVADIGQRLRCDADSVPADSSSRASHRAALSGVSLVHQPLLARLHLLERTTLGGLTAANLVEAEGTFRDVTGGSAAPDGFLVVAEHHNKIGDLLFFKNGPLPPAAERAKRGNVYCHQRGALCHQNPRWKELAFGGRRLPCFACEHYHQALRALCSDYLEMDLSTPSAPILVRILECFDGKRGCRQLGDRPRSVRELADVLSDLGDTFVSCAGVRPEDTGEIGGAFVDNLVDLLALDSRGSVDGRRLSSLKRLVHGQARIASRTGHRKIAEALSYYAVSAILFHHCSNERAWAIQLTKMLWLLREYCAILRRRPAWRPSTLTTLASIAIEALHRCHEGTHRLEIEKLKDVFVEDFGEGATRHDSVRLGNLSINTNITEVLVLRREIELQAVTDAEVTSLDDLVSPYVMFHSVYSRIHALRLRSLIHYRNLRSVGLVTGLAGLAGRHSEDGMHLGANVWSITKGIVKLGEHRSRIVPRWMSEAEGLGTGWDSYGKGLPLLRMMLVDGIYCCHEMVRLLRIYGRSYMASHSMRAAAHGRFAQWCDCLYAYVRYSRRMEAAFPAVWLSERGSKESVTEALKEHLERAIGPADMVHLSPTYQREAALRHLKAAVETHTEGPAYRELLEDMHYLNDDFADHLEHFCAALERLRINSGEIETRVTRLQQELVSTSIYEPERYFPYPVGGPAETTAKG